MINESEVDFDKVYHNLRLFLLDGNFELSILHVKTVSNKLKEITGKPQSLDTQEIRQELENEMESRDSNITASTTTSNQETQNTISSNQETQSTIVEDSKVESVIRGLCDSDNLPKSLTQFYIEHIENGEERKKEKLEQLLSSPEYQIYSTKALQDQDNYLDSLENILRKVCHFLHPRKGGISYISPEYNIMCIVITSTF